MGDGTRTLRAIITGSSAGAVKAFDEVAGASEASAGKMTSTFDQATTKTGGFIGRIGTAAQNMGVPFAGALTGVGNKLDEAKGKSDGFMSSVSRLGGVTLAAGAVGLGAVAAESVHLATSFQSTVTSIAANANIPVAAAQKIGNAFIGTAGQTIYSGQQIGQAYSGVAGVLGVLEGHALTANQAMGVMRSAMDLAEGSGTDLNTATSDLALTMQAYGAKADQAKQYTDALFNTSRITGVGIDTVTQTFQKLHSTLGAVTPSVGQLGGILVDLTEHGETGRKALAAVNTSLNGMLAPTGSVANAQKMMGLSVFDASGHFVGMGSIISQLQPKLAGMSQEQQLAALKAVGMGTANKALLSTILDGPAAFDKAAAAAARTGAAHDAAAKQAQTLQHQEDTVKAAAADLGVKFGEFLIPKLEELMRIVMSVVGWFEKHKLAAEILAGVIGTVLAGAIAVFAVNMGVKMVKSASDALTAVSKLPGAISKMASGISDAASSIVGKFSAMGEASEGYAATVETSSAEAAAAQTEGMAAIETAEGEFAAVSEETGAASSAAFGPIGLAILAVVAIGVLLVTHWKQVKQYLLDAWNAIKDAALTVWNALVGFFKKWGLDILAAMLPMIGIPILLATHWHQVEADAKKIWGAVVHFFEEIPGKLLAIFELITPEGELLKHWHAVFDGAQQVWGDIVNFFTSIPSRILGALSSLGSGLFNLAKTAMGRLLGAIHDGEVDVLHFVEGIPGDIVKAFEGLWDDMVGIGGRIIDGLIHGIENGVGAIGHAIGGIVNKIKGFFTNPLSIFSPSRVFAGYGQNIIEGLALGIGDNAHLATGAIGRLADQMKTTPFTLGRIAGAVAAGGTSSPGSIRASGGLSSAAVPGGTVGSGVVFSPTIHVNGVVGDERAVALAVRNELLKVARQLPGRSIFGEYA